MAIMVVENRNFVEQHLALYEAACRAHDNYNTIAAEVDVEAL